MKLDEGGLARVVKRAKDKSQSHATISAERGDKSKKENKSRSKQLEKDLRGRGYGPKKTTGTYSEKDDKTGEERKVKERSYFVTSGKKGKRKFKKDMKKVAAKHDQDSVLVKQKGTSNAKLHATRKGGLGKSKSETAGKLKAKKGEFSTQVGKKHMTYEETILAKAEMVRERQIREGVLNQLKKGTKRHKDAVEKKKIKNRKAVPYAALAAGYEPEGEELKEYSPNVTYQAKGGKKSGKLGKSSVYSLKDKDESKKEFRKSHTKDIKDGLLKKEEVVNELVGQLVGGAVGTSMGKGIAGKAIGGAVGAAAGEVLDPFKKRKNKNPVGAAVGGAVGGAIAGGGIGVADKALTSKYPETMGKVKDVASKGVEKGKEFVNKGVEKVKKYVKEDEMLEAKVDKGRSDYGKASIRNYRRKGPGHGEPAMFDPENKRGKLIDKRREEHKARRGVKGAKVPAYKVDEGLLNNLKAKVDKKLATAGRNFKGGSVSQTGNYAEKSLKEGQKKGAVKDYLDKKAKMLEAEKKKLKAEYKNNPAFGDPSHHSNAKNRTEETIREGNPVEKAWNWFVPPREKSANPNVRSGKRQPGKLEQGSLKFLNKSAENINKPIKTISKAAKAVKSAAVKAPGAAAAVGGGVVGAATAPKGKKVQGAIGGGSGAAVGAKVGGASGGPVGAAAGAAVGGAVGTFVATRGGKKKSKKEEGYSDWRSDQELMEKVGGAGTLVRQGVKVGGKKGGRAVQAGQSKAIAAGKGAKESAKGGNKSKMVGDGKFERAGAVVGGVTGGVAGAIVDGPLPIGDIVGGIAGAKVGGKIGRQIDKIGSKKPKKLKKENMMYQHPFGKFSGMI